MCDTDYRLLKSFKDVRVKIFESMVFFFLIYCGQTNVSCVRNAKKGFTDFSREN